jgi:glycosyltransferase involved in cell wall biosynthesis
MKILLVTGEYPPMQGGVGDYTHELSVALLAQGTDVHVLTSPAPSTRSDDLSRPSTSEPSVHRLVARWGWNILPLVAGWVRGQSPDVVHIQYQTAAYGMHPAVNFLPAWLHSRVGRAIRVVVTYHDVNVPYLFPKAHALRTWITYQIGRSADAAVATNAEDHVALTAALPRRPYLIPIGSNIAMALPPGFDRERQRIRWGFGPPDIVLCYFGFLNESKGGDSLIRVLDSLVKSGYNCSLLMIGGKVGSSDPTNIAYAQRIDALIDEIGLSGRVVWTGFSDAEEVSANLLAADICILPYRDGASFRRGSFMAALAHGRPIVSTEPRVSIPELRHGENILFAPPDDVSTLAGQVVALINNPAQRSALGAAASLLSASFGWDHIARQTMEVYHDLGLR